MVDDAICIQHMASYVASMHRIRNYLEKGVGLACSIIARMRDMRAVKLSATTMVINSTSTVAACIFLHDLYMCTLAISYYYHS